jgi:single-strand DNA-binding protein
MRGNTLTITGNLTGDPELRFTSSGQAVCNFTVAVTDRVQDKESGAWKDGETAFFRCDVWRDVAENVAESIHKGDRVTVTGSLRQRSYETKEGEKRTVTEVAVEEIAVSLRYVTVKVSKATRRGAHSGPVAAVA